MITDKNSKSPEPPVKPIGKIPYKDLEGFLPPSIEEGGAAGEVYYASIRGRGPAKYDFISNCKEYCDKVPFSVYKSNIPGDERPFKVTFSWTNYAASSGATSDIYMTEVLEEHSSVTAAKRAMRSFAKAAFDKINTPVTAYGKPIHNVIQVDGVKQSICIGDLVSHSSFTGTIFEVVGECLKSGQWMTRIKPAFNFFATVKAERHITQYDTMNLLRHVDIAVIGTKFAELQLFLQERIAAASR